VGHENFSGEAAGTKFVRNAVKIIDVCNWWGVQWTIEKPHSSRLWDLPPIRKLESKKNTEVAIIDQCEFNLKDPVSQLLYRKRTRIIGSVPGLSGLSVRCSGQHSHQHVEDSIVFEGKCVKRSTLAGRYPVSLCQQLAALVLRAQASNHSARARRVGPSRC
jgi:hypothetical protein